MPRRKANTQRLDSLQSAPSGVDVLFSNLLPAATEGEEVTDDEEAVPYNYNVYVCDDHDSDEEESSRKKLRKAPNRNKKQRLGAAVTIVSRNNQGDDDRVKLGRLNMHLGGQDGDGRETAENPNPNPNLDVASLALKLSVRILLCYCSSSFLSFLVCDDVSVSLLSIYFSLFALSDTK
jgi:hypothetical protein